MHITSPQARKHSKYAPIKGAPGVSQKWASLEPRTADVLTDVKLLLLKSVQAEDIFKRGAGDLGGRENSEGNSNLLLNLEGRKLAPTPEGLPDPLAQQALLHPLGSQHSPLERRARNAHAKALGVAAMSAPTPASSSSASRGQVASQLN